MVGQISMLPPACNWFCSQVLDVNWNGTRCVYASRNDICVIEITALGAPSAATPPTLPARTSGDGTEGGGGRKLQEGSTCWMLGGGHTDRVQSVAFPKLATAKSGASAVSPGNLHLLASASIDGCVSLWDTEGSVHLASHRLHQKVSYFSLNSPPHFCPSPSLALFTPLLLLPP